MKSTCRRLGDCVLAAFAAPAFAQGDQGRIAGIVRDSSGAFVAGAPTVRQERADRRRAIGGDQRSGLLRDSPR